MPYLYVAGHVDVSGERLLALGDVIEEPDQRLIDQGFVIPIEEPAEKPPAPPAPPLNPVTDEPKESPADATGN